MATDMFQAQWKQVRGKVKQQWGKLTDDDLDRIQGHWDELVGIIQEKYNKERHEVENDLEKFANDMKQQIRDA